MQENVPDLTVPNLDCSGRQYALSGKCCWRPAENIHGSSSGKMCPVPCHRTKERILKLSSTNYYTSESLPEVEQISLFSNMASGGASQTTELLPIELSMLNGGESPSAGAEYMLSAILVENPPEWSFLSEKALNGILNRASRRGKKLQDLLLTAIHGMIEWWQQNPAGGGWQREAYTMKIRSGCDGGGKGPLVQEELSATLATHQDQTLFELRNTVLNDQGGGFMEVTHGMTGTLRAQEHGHAPITFDKTEGNEKT